MLKNYIRIGLRHIKKQKLFSFINLSGLAIGLAFCTLFMLFIVDELSFDQFHQHKADIYRLYRDPLIPGIPFNKELAMPIPAGPAMQATFPEVEEFVRLIPFWTQIIRHKEQWFEQEGFLFADSTFFKVFNFPLKYGDPHTALTSPSAVVITEDIAEKYFDSTDAMGKILSVRMNGQYYDFQVSGVAESVPSNSSIQFEILLPFSTLANISDDYNHVRDRWDATRCITYLKLREGTHATHVQELMPRFMETYMGGLFDEARTSGHLKSKELPFVYRLQPLLDIHFNMDVPEGITPPTNPLYSYILAGIALAVLLIACFNFTILTIGRSAQRAKEVGVRKVIGARRTQLMLQFWGEALLLCLGAFVFGMVLVGLCLPWFNTLVGKELGLVTVLHHTSIMGILVGIFLFTGWVAGSYPAIILSGFKPIDSLKEKVSLSGSNAFTKALIVIQFSISVFLVMSTLVMVHQLNYMKTKDLGFRGEQVVIIPVDDLDGAHALKLFHHALDAHTNVVSISGANFSFPDQVWRRGFKYKEEVKQVVPLRVDANFMETLQMRLIEGRNFDPSLASDSTESILVNEAFLREFGWTSPIGQILPIQWRTLQNPKVIGVVKDFNLRSLHAAIEPVVIHINPDDPINNLLVRVTPHNIPATLDVLQATWKNITTDVPFRYRFLDEDIARLYRDEERWSQMVGYGSFFAIFVACLGLFGLAGIVAFRRQKEIGIRKVMGASLQHILVLLSKGYIRLIVIAFAVAMPVANYFMSEWLQSFAYRIAISWWMFAIPGVLVLFIALLSITGQTWRAAHTNPVDSLRDE